MGYPVPLMSQRITLSQSSDVRVIPIPGDKHSYTRVVRQRDRLHAKPSVRSVYELYDTFSSYSGKGKGWKVVERLVTTVPDCKLSRIRIGGGCLVHVGPEVPRQTWFDGTLWHTQTTRVEFTVSSRVTVEDEKECEATPAPQEPRSVREAPPTCPLCAAPQWYVVQVLKHDHPTEVRKADHKVKAHQKYRASLPSRFDRFDEDEAPEEPESEDETIDPEDFNDWEGPQGRQPKLQSRVRAALRAKS